jgi:hypothetical protein
MTNASDVNEPAMVSPLSRQVTSLYSKLEDICGGVRHSCTQILPTQALPVAALGNVKKTFAIDELCCAHRRQLGQIERYQLHGHSRESGRDCS